MEDVRNPEAREKQGDTFGAAVPGQSLTTPPAGNPYERPPEETDPKKILSFAIKRLNEPKVKEEMMDLLLIQTSGMMLFLTLIMLALLGQSR